MSFRQWLANAALIGVCIAFLVHFALIVHYGRVYIQEPNRGILALEVVLFVGLIALAVYNMIKGVRR